jgi:hypothetical protein
MTSGFTPVPQLGTTDDLAADIVTWTNSEPLRALVRAFGGDDDLTAVDPADLATGLARLDEFTDRWDTRNGRERNQAYELHLTEPLQELVIGAADALGLRAVRAPRHESYDYILLLGGLVRACVARPAYAAHLIGDGGLRVAEIVALGGHRPFIGDEFDYAAVLGLDGVAEEYQALDAGTRRAFGLGEPEKVRGEESDLVGGTWGFRRYRTADDLSVTVAAAPSSEPEARRANTPDTYAWFAERLVHLRPGQRLLLVTTPIYVPAQHAAAVRMLQLPYGVSVETVGNDPAVVGVAGQGSTPTKYLQEIRSTIRALRQFRGPLTTN